jgi:hypothetical protein
VAQHVLSVHEALDSIPSIAKINVFLIYMIRYRVEVKGLGNHIRL